MFVFISVLLILIRCLIGVVVVSMTAEPDVSGMIPGSDEVIFRIFPESVRQ